MKKIEELFICAFVGIFAILRFPSLFEPYWYGDEGVYQVIGMALRQGRTLYSGIWDNKPPILYLIYAVFNGDQFYVRLFSLLVGILTIVLFHLLVFKLFKNFTARIISTAFFAVMFGAPLIEGNIANAENFMLLPVIASFYLILMSKAKTRFLFAFLSGILMSIAFLTKIVGVFDMAALFTTLFIARFFEDISLTRKNIHSHIKDILNGLEQETVLVVGFVVPIIITVLVFLYNGAWNDFLRATFSQNVGYVGNGNFFIVPLGFLYLKLALLLFSILLIIRYRKTFGRAGVLVLVWVVFSMFNAFFSQRPYTHYLLVLLPSYSLLIGYVLESRKLLKINLPLILITTILVLTVFKLNFKKVVPYYINFFAFTLNMKTIESYQAFFDGNTPRDYALVNFIKSKTKDSDNVFLWSDSPQIYALSGKLPPGRYTVSYHVTFYPDAVSETKAAIEKMNVKYIIQTKQDPTIQQFLDRYELRYKMNGATIYERKT